MYVYIYTLEAFSFGKVSWRGVKTTNPSGTAQRHLLGWVSGKSVWSGILVCILMFSDAGRVKPRRTQGLYFELQLHGSWGLHNCSGVPLKLHTLKKLCGFNKSCIPLPPSLMCVVPSVERSPCLERSSWRPICATCRRQTHTHTNTLPGTTTAATAAAQITKLSHSNHSSRAA